MFLSVFSGSLRPLSSSQIDKYFSSTLLSPAMAETGKITLYSHWLSSCSQRVRIALNLKGLDYEYKTVNILNGKIFDPEFEKLNPVKFVPALVDGDFVSCQVRVYLHSKPYLFAGFIKYLEDKYPQHPLLPQDLKKKALNIQIASIVTSSIQPLQNTCVIKYIEEKIDSEAKLAWAQLYINNGFAAIEKLIKETAGKYATGDEVYLADLFLAPQIYGAISRFQIDMSLYPTLARVSQAYDEHPAFQAAHPLKQPDAPLQS